jgi:hypothetical protein
MQQALEGLDPNDMRIIDPLRRTLFSPETTHSFRCPSPQVIERSVKRGCSPMPLLLRRVWLRWLFVCDLRYRRWYAVGELGIDSIFNEMTESPFQMAVDLFLVHYDRCDDLTTHFG